MPRTAFYFIPSVMTGFIVSVFPFRNRVSSTEAFEVLELGEGKLSRPVLRGPGGRKAAWLLGHVPQNRCFREDSSPTARCTLISPTSAIRTPMFVGSLTFFGSESVRNAGMRILRVKIAGTSTAPLLRMLPPFSSNSHLFIGLGESSLPVPCPSFGSPLAPSSSRIDYRIKSFDTQG